MLKKNQKAVLSVALLAGCVLMVNSLFHRPSQNSNPSFIEPLPESVRSAEPMSGISETDFQVSSDFSSHLPLVILDTNGVNPPIYTEKKLVDGEYIFVNIPGVEPLVHGTLTIINNPGGERNHLQDSPATVSSMEIKRRGNSSMLYDKPQYKINLVSEKGEKTPQSILGMGEDSEWILNGSVADKSMLRNYLSYRMASKIMPYTPDEVFCEVFIKDGDSYCYQGVYLMGENIKQGANRVNIEPYNPSDSVHSFLVRRDRRDEDAIALNTYATENHLTKGVISILYPSKKNISESSVEYIENRFTEVERILYSNNSKVFATYDRYLDVDSFVDFFLVNEFFTNYDCGIYSTYMYSHEGGKISMGPVWDFDGGMDNYINEELSVEDTAFNTKPYFDRLCTDKTFIRKLQKRYAKLRRTVLSKQAVNDEIDSIIAYLGDAQTREWTRWGYIYKYAQLDENLNLKDMVDEDGDVQIRDFPEFSQEINRIKTMLSRHGDELATRLQELEYNCTQESGMTSRMDLVLLLVMLTLFIAVTYTKHT